MRVYLDNWGKFLSAFLVGVVTLAIVGTSWWGYASRSTQREQQVAAQVELAADVCDAQFRASPDAALVFEELKKVPYNQGNVIEKGNWHLMPGQKSALSYGVSRRCAELVLSRGPPKAVAAK